MSETMASKYIIIRCSAIAPPELGRPEATKPWYRLDAVSQDAEFPRVPMHLCTGSHVDTMNVIAQVQGHQETWNIRFAFLGPAEWSKVDLWDCGDDEQHAQEILSSTLNAITRKYKAFLGQDLEIENKYDPISKGPTTTYTVQDNWEGQERKVWYWWDVKKVELKEYPSY